MGSALQSTRKPENVWAQATAEITERQWGTDAQGNVDVRSREGAAASRSVGRLGARRRAGNRDLCGSPASGLRQPQAACAGNRGLVSLRGNSVEFSACT